MTQQEIQNAVYAAQQDLDADILLIRERQTAVYHYFLVYLLDKYGQGVTWQPMTAAILTRNVFQCYTGFVTDGSNFIADNEQHLVKTLAFFDLYFDHLQTRYINTSAFALLPTAAFLASFMIASNCVFLGTEIEIPEPVLPVTVPDVMEYTQAETGTGSEAYITLTANDTINGTLEEFILLDNADNFDFESLEIEDGELIMRWNNETILPGKYVLTYRIKNQYGWSNSSTVTITVLENEEETPAPENPFMNALIQLCTENTQGRIFYTVDFNEHVSVTNAEITQVRLEIPTATPDEVIKNSIDGMITPANTSQRNAIANVSNSNKIIFAIEYTQYDEVIPAELHVILPHFQLDGNNCVSELTAQFIPLLV